MQFNRFWGEMDVIELSQKMERDLLESHSKDFKHSGKENFSPRLTRSQTSKGLKAIVEETDVPERNHRKIDEVEKICFRRKARTLHTNLETIYEDPILKKGNTMLLGTSKVKRFIYLDREFRIKSKQKSKLRKIKIKRLGKRMARFKLSDAEFKSRMMTVENFINENTDEVVRTKTDIKLNNFNSNEDCSNLQNGNADLTKPQIDSINETENSELGNESVE